MKISLDTNVLIDNPSIVFDATREFVVSFTVIRELDKLKRNPDLKRAAQDAIRNIWSQYSNNKLEVLNIPTTLGDSLDELIVLDTKNSPDTALLSEDIGARLIAKVVGVPISNFDSEVVDYSYTGYVTIDGDLEYENTHCSTKEMQLEEFNGTFDTDLKENQYCIVKRIIDREDIWVNHRGTVTRISQSTKQYSDTGITAKPMDSVQACVLDAVYRAETPLVIVDGALGTGCRAA